MLTVGRALVAKTRPAARMWPAVLILACLTASLAGCAGPPAPDGPKESPTGVTTSAGDAGGANAGTGNPADATAVLADPLSGLVATNFPGAASPNLDELIANRAEAPLASEMTVYRDPAAATPALTVTVLAYAGDRDALILYNNYFASRAFHAAAERRSLALGDQAELVELGWPPMHALYARAGPRFVLAEASPDLGPPERRQAALAALAALALAAP